MQYPAELECEFYVKAPDGYSIVFTIIDFRIEWIYDILFIKVKMCIKVRRMQLASIGVYILIRITLTCKFCRCFIWLKASQTNFQDEK